MTSRVALQEGLIEQKFQTPEMLAQITSYIFSGPSATDNADAKKLGLLVWDKVSQRRFPFRGTITIGGKVQPAANPIYDPSYGTNAAQVVMQQPAET